MDQTPGGARALPVLCRPAKGVPHRYPGWPKLGLRARGAVLHSSAAFLTPLQAGRAVHGVPNAFHREVDHALK